MIPVYLQQFKSAGVYRVVFDKSTISNVNASILRLVVGYSEVGPFNIPVLVRNPQDFRTYFGDISSKLEKRGIYFHRLALQMLSAGPILCLNLKKFENETLKASTISTDFVSGNISDQDTQIPTVDIKVEDIYDTTRFWEVSAEKLINLRGTDDDKGSILDKYIDISTTDVKKNSISYFIRKASGAKVSAYNITVNDWYADGSDEMPEYLEKYRQNLVSDFFAEIYVFKGEFDKNQVMTSETLKNYFDVDSTGLKLKPFVKNAYGDSVDTLDTLYTDGSSNAIGHYIGSLIPGFKSKNGVYMSLDIVFNNDIDYHNCMIAFNTDLLEEQDNVSIDLSGRSNIVNNTINPKADNVTTSVLGNFNSEIVKDKITFSTNIKDSLPVDTVSVDGRVLNGSFYVSEITNTKLTLTAFEESTGTASTCDLTFGDGITLETKLKFLETLNVVAHATTENPQSLANYAFIAGEGSYFSGDTVRTTLAVPQILVTSLYNLPESTEEDDGVYAYTLSTNEDVLKIGTTTYNVYLTTESQSTNDNSVYGSSISTFAKDNYTSKSITVDGVTYDHALVTDKYYDTSLVSLLSVGDALISNLGQSSNDVKIVYVNGLGTIYDESNDDNPETTPGYKHYVLLSDSYQGDNIVRLNAALNQEIGTLRPVYLEGYTYKNAKPANTSMYEKLQWQKKILSTLTTYKGLRTGLLNKSDIDYRYIIDTFESFPDENLKNVFSYLAKEKQSALCISNFPAIKSFVKCPYTSFTDNGTFNINYVVEGYNKKKASTKKFSLPTDADGASFIAFYTPLKFTDGYVDAIIPSAGLVSNLFMNKYTTRQPYYIVAGPNYGAINAAGLVGPDYKYSREELNVIEPYGVNCMVYRPGFGTFINANQTAKQTPVSALSKVNVRELVIYLQDEIEKVLQSYQWEFNNPRTRQAILDKANYICSLVASNGGIQAYLNVMDESNNTPEIIDNEMAILSTHIEPGMGCGKMVHELTIYRTGQIKATILD